MFVTVFVFVMLSTCCGVFLYGNGAGSRVILKGLRSMELIETHFLEMELVHGHSH